QINSLRREVDAVLDAVDTGLHRLQDPVGGNGVREYGQGEPSSFRRDRLELRRRVVRRVRVSPGGQHAATRGDLHAVRPAPGQVPYRLPEVVRPIDNRLEIAGVDEAGRS